ncbi:unnamed protein product, partial [Protopolystoma xenopodis]
MAGEDSITDIVGLCAFRLSQADAALNKDALLTWKTDPGSLGNIRDINDKKQSRPRTRQQLVSVKSSVKKFLTESANSQHVRTLEHGYSTNHSSDIARIKREAAPIIPRFPDPKGSPSLSNSYLLPAHDCKQPDAGEICYNVSAKDILDRNKTGAYSDADVRMRIRMTKQRSPTWVADDERFSDNSKK